MSSDGKPLWGFRKIFFLLGAGYLLVALWLLSPVLSPTEQFKSVNPPGSANYIVHLAVIPVLTLLGIAQLWFWGQLRSGNFTSRNWRVGIGLLVPALAIIPFGPLCMVSWCSKPCRDLFA
jgi:hypothetical protein